MTICTPANGATVSTNVRVAAGSTSSTPVTAMQIYVDSTLAYSVNATELDVQLTIPTGTHKLTVKAWTSAGTRFSSAVTVTATPSTGPCELNQTDPSVTICQPTSGATVDSPVRIVAGTKSTSPVTAMKIYVDNTLQYSVNASQLDTSLPMAAGSHFVVVQAWNQAGQIFKAPVTINVGGGSGSAPCPLDAADPSITICQPANGSTISSPVRIVARAKSSAAPVTAMKIYVDNVDRYTTASSTLDTQLDMGPGSHYVVVQAWNQAGTVFKKAYTINVSGSTPTGDMTAIKHVIFFLQENRSFDNYFGRMGQYRRDRGFNDPIAELPLDKAYPDVAGHMVAPYHFRTVCHENLSPGWNETHFSVNGGAMDQFMLATRSIPSSIDPDGTRAMGYYDWTDLPYYYELAFQFAMSDQFYSSIMAPTIPNRMYLFAGTSFGHIFPNDPKPASGKWPNTTIFDRLTQAGISWRYYYQDNSVYLAEWDTWNRDSAKVKPISSYYTDLQNEATFPQVVFIERAAETGLDEHPLNNIQKGAANTKKIIDALMNSPTWPSSAFFFSFDEPGGLFDHVPPFKVAAPDGIQPIYHSSGDIRGDFTDSGLRVPFILISPYAKPHYVSHTKMELTSIIRFIEQRFKVPSLTARDAQAPDMMEFFDFTSAKLLRPPVLPDQPTTGLCDFQAEKAPGH